MKRKFIRMYICLVYVIKNINFIGCLIDLFDYDVIFFFVFYIFFRVIIVI